MKRQAIFEFGMLWSLFIVVGVWGAMVIAWIGHLVKMVGGWIGAW